SSAAAFWRNSDTNRSGVGPRSTAQRLPSGRLRERRRIPRKRRRAGHRPDSGRGPLARRQWSGRICLNLREKAMATATKSIDLSIRLPRKMYDEVCRAASKDKRSLEDEIAAL